MARWRGGRWLVCPPMVFYYAGTVIFLILAVVVVVVGMRQFNRPKCPSCGLSVGRDLATCPYCHASMRG